MLTADHREKALSAPLVLGLVYSSLTALKPSFAIFVLLQFPLVALAMVGSTTPSKTGEQRLKKHRALQVYRVRLPGEPAGPPPALSLLIRQSGEAAPHPFSSNFRTHKMSS